MSNMDGPNRQIEVVHAVYRSDHAPRACCESGVEQVGDSLQVIMHLPALAAGHLALLCLCMRLERASWRIATTVVNEHGYCISS